MLPVCFPTTERICTSTYCFAAGLLSDSVFNSTSMPMESCRELCCKKDRREKKKTPQNLFMNFTVSVISMTRTSQSDLGRTVQSFWTTGHLAGHLRISACFMCFGKYLTAVEDAEITAIFCYVSLLYIWYFSITGCFLLLRILMPLSSCRMANIWRNSTEQMPVHQVAFSGPMLCQLK